MTFEAPWVFLFIPISILILFYVYRNRNERFVLYPSAVIGQALSKSWRVRFIWVPFVLRCVALVLLIFALANPRLSSQHTEIVGEGIDIVLAIDVSGSMAAEDFYIERRRVNRLDIVKKVVNEFVEKRTYDRISLIAFAGVAYTVCPLTTDYDWLLNNLSRIRLGLIEDGTAIGSAIASSLNRLKESDATSKIMILLTDGVNNAGEIDPVKAAKAAQLMGVRIYTIGAGTRGSVPYPAEDFFGRKVYQNVRIEIDESVLKGIAETTGGRYYRATDTESLLNIYDEIGTLEKTEIEEVGYYEYELLFGYFVLGALFIISLEMFLRNFIFRRVP